MANDYFRFKQFIIHQNKCAMKVCTDACVFGAWVAHSSLLKARSVLDIGTGTGLLALMYAQKNPNAIIDAVEIDDGAAKQASENFANSPWKDNFNVHNLSIQNFSADSSKKYDLIISNPPFYENELKSENKERNLALHSSELSFENLLSAVDQLLADDGSFCVLLPYHRAKWFEELAVKQELFVKEKLLLKQTATHDYFRTILCCTRKNGSFEQSNLTVMHSNHMYTKEFSKLLKDYYLHL